LSRIGDRPGCNDHRLLTEDTLLPQPQPAAFQLAKGFSRGEMDGAFRAAAAGFRNLQAQSKGRPAETVRQEWPGGNASDHEGAGAAGAAAKENRKLAGKRESIIAVDTADHMHAAARTSERYGHHLAALHCNNNDQAIWLRSREHDMPHEHASRRSSAAGPTWSCWEEIVGSGLFFGDTTTADFEKASVSVLLVSS
jgi:hypothetical protein